MPRLAGFVGPSYTLASKIAANDRMVNLYPSKIESGTGKAEYTLDPAPGHVAFCTLPKSPVRGLYTLNGAAFAIGGTSLYELPSTVGGTPIERATGLHNPDDDRAEMAGNGDAGFQLLIASGSRKSSLDLRTNVLTSLDGAATQCGYMDGYGLALDPSRSELSFSALADFTSWDALDVVQRNDTADKWLAMLVRQKDLLLFGLEGTSVYFNSGDADTPWVPNASIFIPQGIGAPRSAALLNGIPYWLGNGKSGGRIVYRGAAERISTHAVEYALSTYSTVADARGWTYQDQGHDFYVLTFPTAGATWVYDATTGLWHERGEWDGTDYTGLSVDGHIYVGGRHLTGSTTSGVIYQIRSDVMTGIDGTGLRRMRRAPHLWNEGKRVTYSRFALEMEVGVGLASGQGSDPQVMLRWSDDGGQTWGNVHEMSVGAMGAYSTMVEHFQLGQARDRVFEVSMSDPVPYRIVSASFEARAGRS